MKTLYKLLLAFLILTFLNFVPLSTSAQEVQVHAVLFYSPSCPHCHLVINEFFPPLIEEYGDNLNIIGIDVSDETGSILYDASVTKFQIPDSRYGVPTLIVGETVLVGSVEIPEQFPSIIEDGLASGGIPWPDIPGLKEILIEQELVTVDTTSPAGSEDISESDEPKNSIPQSVNSNPKISQTETDLTGNNQSTGLISSAAIRFNQDRLGNTIAILVLLLMIISVLLIAISYVRGTFIIKICPPDWLIPILGVFGLLVAIYLSYVEVSSSSAVCGPVGDCNAVQESTYAFLFGMIPIGLIGILGYASIVFAWIIRFFGPNTIFKYSTFAIWFMAWIGVFFSIYLTFLEPFVIGATCMWCVTSAIIMTALLWVSTPPIIDIWQISDEDFEIEAI